MSAVGLRLRIYYVKFHTQFIGNLFFGLQQPDENLEDKA